jgi:hypothetical protein
MKSIILIALFVVGVWAECEEQNFFAAGGDSGSNAIDYQYNTLLDNGEWTTLSSVYLPFNVFGGLSVNNTAYIGSNVIQFSGLYYQVDSSSTESNKIVWEFWNGVSWQAVPIMTMNAATPFDTFGSSFFSNSQCERLVLGLMPNWATTTLNGITDYWIRLRITQTLSANIQIEQLVRYYDQFEVYSGGYTHYTESVGDRMQLTFRSTASLSSTYIGDFPIYGHSFVKNVGSGTETTASTTVRLPGDIDTSKNAKLELIYTTTSTGNVLWVVSVLSANSGSVTSSGSLSPPSVQWSTSVAVSSTANRVSHLNVLVPIHSITSRPASGDPDELVIGLKRYSLSGSDTCSSSAILYGTSLKYAKFNDGVHIQLY